MLKPIAARTLPARASGAGWRTLDPLSSWSLRVDLAALGGDPGEPINLELRYVYTIDEFPLPAKELPVPAWRTVSSERTAFEALGECGARR